MTENIVLADVGWESHRSTDVYSCEPVEVPALTPDGEVVTVLIAAVMVQRDNYYRPGEDPLTTVSVYPDSAMEPWMSVTNEVTDLLLKALPTDPPPRPIL